MPRLLIVYHSLTGGTRQMAEAAATAARDECDTTLLTAPEAGPDDLLSHDGYLFAAPENLAAIAGVMKEFYDRSYYPVLGKIEGRPYAQMVCAGSDGENAARQTARCRHRPHRPASPAAGIEARQTQTPSSGRGRRRRNSRHS